MERDALPPSENLRLIYREAALLYRLFQMAVRELLSAIPPDAQKYDYGPEVAALERGPILSHGDESPGYL